MGAVQTEISELVAGSRHPFVRHVAGGPAYDAAWTNGDAVVLRGDRHTVVLGPPDDVGPLLEQLVDEFVPARLTVEAAAYPVVPDPWAYPRQGHWHWMRCVTPVPPPAVPCEELTDAGAIEAVLDLANPGSFARPGMPGIESWLGVREGRRLVGVGAIRRDPDGSGHLRGVSVLPTHTGRGLGRALSTALTRLAQDRSPYVATLGVYVDNVPAVRIYDRLGYAIEHTFVSGALSSPS